MIDREKVINGLELLAHWPEAIIFIDREKWIQKCCEMAVSMLKWQEVIVRCKDCLWYDQRDGQCEHHICINNTSPEWFCADGERKKEND